MDMANASHGCELPQLLCVFIVAMLTTNKTTLQIRVTMRTQQPKGMLSGNQQMTLYSVLFFFEFSRESTDASWFTLYPGGEMFVNCKLCDSEIYAKDSVKHWPQLHMVCILLSTSWFVLD